MHTDIVQAQYAIFFSPLFSPLSFLFFSLRFFSSLQVRLVSGGIHEKKLLNDLLDSYNVLERPVQNESEPLRLSFGLTLMQIIDVEWNDVNMVWDPSKYGNVRDLRIPPHRLWKPDVLMYNSWIFNFRMNLGGDISSFITNGEWDLLGVPGKRNEIYYNCCPEPYIDITFVVIIRRRTLYYFFNLIVPCVLIASMAVLGFTLPPDSGEKLSLGVTILLSLTVFLNMVAETMPATSDAVPLLGTYFNCIMFMVASSVVSTILILNYHHRNSDTHEMSDWVRVVFLDWLPCILRMSRPIPEDDELIQKSQKPSPVTGPSKSYGDLELHQRSSKSLLANVLDLEDNALASHNNLLNNVYSTPGPHHHGHVHVTPHHHHHPHTATTTPHHQHQTPMAHSSYPPPPPPPVSVGHQLGHTPHHHAHPPTDPNGEPLLQSACFCARYELILILKEIKIITNQLKDNEVSTKIANDWKFAAMVIDRMCLIIFTLFTIIATITVLFSAPHIIVT
ncbi:unnamed protein product [Trichogramma brassicae]|uniref:Neurotransmitter-gated ion-channel ligand-binding domain-containing protein n=1 Tax=Trichogramma brassicae TaxID=86971 RepID=A0A6H5I168_9HYME|nr:unnamed protein product [Trichogramma brassicae]